MVVDHNYKNMNKGIGKLKLKLRQNKKKTNNK